MSGIYSLPKAVNTYAQMNDISYRNHCNTMISMFKSFSENAQKGIFSMNFS